MSVTVTTRPSNGVSYGIKHTVTAAEVADGTVIFDFENGLNLVVTYLMIDSINEILPRTGMIITYPLVGQVQFSGFSWSLGDVLHFVANRARTD